MLAKKAREVLESLQAQGVLRHLILIGSWCGHFYEIYFGRNHYAPNIQTLDIDLLIPQPEKLGSKVTPVETLLEPLDFVEDYTADGWLRFVHPELRVEFLVPRIGRQSDDPRSIPQLKVNAMPLRHTHVLTQHVIEVKEGKLKIYVPHPGAFALHKLFVSTRRKEKDKADRDLAMALRILEVIKAKEPQALSKIWKDFTKKEQAKIISLLQAKEMRNPDGGVFF